MNNITVKFNEDWRAFKKGHEITIPVKTLGVTYLVGPNGCGKSSILRAIRVTNDTLEAQRKSNFDGCRTIKITDVIKDVEKGIIEVSGLNKYSHIYAFDAEADDCSNFANSATAYALVSGGGYAALRSSRGQTALVQFARFMNQFKADADKAFEKKDTTWRPLVIVDEVDEGLDIRMQLQWNALLESKFCLRMADVLIVSHNVACMMSKHLVQEPHAIDITTGKETTPSQYIKDMTGVTFSLDYSEEKSWQEQVERSQGPK